MEVIAPPPTDPLVRKEPPFDWYRTPDETRPRVETPGHLPDLDPDVALWPVTPVNRWPFTGAPTEGIWPRGWIGVDNTGTAYVCTVGGEPGTWAAVGSGGGLSDWGQASTAHFSGSGSPVGVVTPSGEGDLYVDDTTPGLWQATGATSADWAQVGTSVQGASIVRKFPFAFNTPGILTGAALYTPTVGDILLDAWIEIDTAWDGTTPLGDVGTFIGGGTGLWASQLFPLDMALADIDQSNSQGMKVGNNTRLSDIQTLLDATLYLAANTITGAISQSVGAASDGGTRIIPMKFTAANPIEVVVSQDGTNTGADPGSTQGAGVLYLVTATPA